MTDKIIIQLTHVPDDGDAKLWVNVEDLDVDAAQARFDVLLGMTNRQILRHFTGALEAVQSTRDMLDGTPDAFHGVLKAAGFDLVEERLAALAEEFEAILDEAAPADPNPYSLGEPYHRNVGAA